MCACVCVCVCVCVRVCVYLVSNEALGHLLLLLRVERLEPELGDQVPELAERLQPVLGDRRVVVGVRPRVLVKPATRGRESEGGSEVLVAVRHGGKCDAQIKYALIIVRWGFNPPSYSMNT